MTHHRDPKTPTKYPKEAITIFVTLMVIAFLLLVSMLVAVKS